jgi:hypothetical protein
MSFDEGLSIEGRGASDELKGKEDKQGEYDCIDEKKLRVYKFDLNVVLRWLLLALI